MAAIVGIGMGALFGYLAELKISASATMPIARWATTLDKVSSSLHNWIVFPAWKVLSGKANKAESVKLGDVYIYSETYGSGPPVLVLHGGLGSIGSMSYQIMALAKCHLVIAADSRGHGRSSDTDASLSYATMSDDMVKLLDHLHIQKVSVVGWSDGGIFGLDLAIRHPERIEKLVADRPMLRQRRETPWRGTCLRSVISTVRMRGTGRSSKACVRNPTMTG